MKAAIPWQSQGSEHTGPTLYQEVQAARPPPNKPLCSAGGMAAGCPLPEPTLVAPLLAFLWSVTFSLLPRAHSAPALESPLKLPKEHSWTQVPRDLIGQTLC